MTVVEGRGCVGGVGGCLHGVGWWVVVEVEVGEHAGVMEMGPGH